MTKEYYKIVSSNCMFKTTYDIKDIKSITPGSQFVAQEPREDTKEIVIQAEKPVLHFTDNAFDTMLWYPIFSTTSYADALGGFIREACIYEIKPVTRVVKDRSFYNDKLLFRCGANIIEFKKIIPVEQVAQKAVQEYEHGKFWKNLAYGREHCMQCIDFWKRRYSL